MEDVFCSNAGGQGTNRSLDFNGNQSESEDWSSRAKECIDDVTGNKGFTSFQKPQQLPLIETDRTIAIIYVTIMVTAFVIGTFGNTMIIIVTSCVSSIRRTGYQFILNLATADLCVAAIADPMCVIAVLKGEAWFNDSPGLCDTIAAMCLTACFCAFLSLTLASLNRYVFVCHNMIYDRIFTKWTCAIMCLVAWVVAFLFEFPNFIGWGQHGFDKKSHQCIWDRTASLSYTLMVSIGLIGFPLFTMGFFFIAIFRKIYGTKSNLYNMESNGVHSSMKVWAETVKSSKLLFVIFVLFVLLWTPYGVVISVDVMDIMSVKLHLFVTMMAHLHSSANFIIYIICNRKFRHSCLRILRCQRLIRTSVISSENRHTTPKITSITFPSNDHFKGMSRSEKISNSFGSLEG